MTLSIRKPMVGFMLAHEQFPVPELVELGVLAEQAGFDLLANSDHFQPWQSNEGHAGHAWITMSALGQRTKKVWIGPTVTCPTFRYPPAVVAEAFASLSLLYPGRIFLGIGSGEALNEEAAIGSWPKWHERSERLVEATQVIRELWKGQQIDHRGKYYTVNAKLYDPPAEQIPILMAANVGPKAMHRSVLVEIFVVVGDQKDAKASAELWRFLPKAFKTYFNIRDPQAIQDRANAEIQIERLISNWPVSTDPEVHSRKVLELFESRATIVNVHSGQADQRRVIEFYGKQVLPRVHKQMQQA